jgi:hypothetical protein
MYTIICSHLCNKRKRKNCININDHRANWHWLPTSSRLDSSTELRCSISMFIKCLHPEAWCLPSLLFKASTEPRSRPVLMTLCRQFRAHRMLFLGDAAWIGAAKHVVVDLLDLTSAPTIHWRQEYFPRSWIHQTTKLRNSHPVFWKAAYMPNRLKKTLAGDMSSGSMFKPKPDLRYKMVAPVHAQHSLKIFKTWESQNLPPFFRYI